MTPNERLELRLAYEAAVENYLAAFLAKYDLYCDPEPWVSNEVGTIAMVGDYFFGFDDIKRCVDEGVEWQDLIEWYDYNCEGGMLGLNQINLKSWLMGAPRASKETIAEIKTRRKELEELIKNQNELSEESNVILDTPIEDLYLSVRLKACLKTAGCKTVKDILEHNKYDFLRRRTFGRRTLAELEDFLRNNNLELNKK